MECKEHCFYLEIYFEFWNYFLKNIHMVVVWADWKLCTMAWNDRPLSQKADIANVTCAVKTTTTLQHSLRTIAVLICHFHAKIVIKSSIIHSVYKSTATTMLGNSTHVTYATEHFPSTPNSEIIKKAILKLNRIYAATQTVEKKPPTHMIWRNMNGHI